MGKAKRKPKPSMPRWFWYMMDGCWFCNTPNNCNRCRATHSFAKEFGEKKQKGRTAGAKRVHKSKILDMEMCD